MTDDLRRYETERLLRQLDAAKALIIEMTDGGRDIDEAAEDAIRTAVGINQDRLDRLIGGMCDDGLLAYSGGRYVKAPTRAAIRRELALI